MNAIESFRQNAGGRGLAYASGTGKNISMRHVAALNRISQSARDVLLSDNFRERLRTPLSRNDLIAHGFRYWAGFWSRLLSAMGGTSDTLRHTKRSRYRCSLPGLAGFTGNRCTKPEVPRIGRNLYPLQAV